MKETLNHISNFRIEMPPILLSQEKTVAWTSHQHSLSPTCPDSKKISLLFERFAVKPHTISKRYMSCPDVLEYDDKNMQVFGATQIDNIQNKTLFYKKTCEKILDNLYPNSNSLPDHMIHVSCTGYVSPSAAQMLISKYNSMVEVTHAYHMGCYASIPAIRIADALATQNTKNSIDIVHTELCSLHMNPHNHSPEQIVIQSLFADGHIAYSVSKSRTDHCLEIVSHKELIVPNSTEDMTWKIDSWGFDMSLSRKVPSAISEALPIFLEKLTEKTQLNLEKLCDEAIFAIHPGGTKIIDSVAKQLQLKEEQISFSKKVLLNRGNMSSATLPHVWNEIIESRPQNNSYIVSLAFGPGLTIFGCIFRYVEKA